MGKNGEMQLFLHRRRHFVARLAISAHHQQVDHRLHVVEVLVARNTPLLLGLHHQQMRG